MLTDRTLGSFKLTTVSMEPVCLAVADEMKGHSNIVNGTAVPSAYCYDTYSRVDS